MHKSEINETMKTPAGGGEVGKTGAVLDQAPPRPIPTAAFALSNTPTHPHRHASNTQKPGLGVDTVPPPMITVFHHAPSPVFRHAADKSLSRQFHRTTNVSASFTNPLLRVCPPKACTSFEQVPLFRSLKATEREWVFFFS